MEDKRFKKLDDLKDLSVGDEVIILHRIAGDVLESYEYTVFGKVKRIFNKDRKLELSDATLLPLGINVEECRMQYCLTDLLKTKFNNLPYNFEELGWVEKTATSYKIYVNIAPED